MGIPMARNLHKAGFLHGVWNRTTNKSSALAQELGCINAATPIALATECEVLVLCVSADQDVLALISLIAPSMPRNALVIDCSTISADSARSAAAILSQHKIDFLDCPVSGGTEGAKNAALAIMCGGEVSAFERAKPILAAMGRAVTHFGPSGAGQSAKATNQIMCAGIIRAVSEAMAFARAQNLPLESLVETLGQGAGSSWYFVNRAPNMIRGAYPAGFKVRLHEKDLRICREMAAAHGVALPTVEEMLCEYEELITQGFGDEDISAVHRLKQALFKR